jgi:hypothetical protein
VGARRRRRDQQSLSTWLRTAAARPDSRLRARGERDRERGGKRARGGRERETERGLEEGRGMQRTEGVDGGKKNARASCAVFQFL